MYTHYKSAVSCRSKTNTALEPLKRPSTGLSRTAPPGDFEQYLVPTSYTKPRGFTPVGDTSQYSSTSAHQVSQTHPGDILQMHVDMTLATSYKPVLVCIVKVSILMMFHYMSVPLLFATERYALIVAVLYVDNWLAYEYIVNTNSCVTTLAASLLVHELRDAGVQERVHGELVHNVVLAVLVGCNIVVLGLGEEYCFTYRWFHLYATPLPNATVKRLRHPPSYNYQANNQASNQTTYRTSPLLCMLLNCGLLVMLSTCAMPENTHDAILNNIRVWSFMILSLTWLYTVHYHDLLYSNVAPFTPCVLRFSSVLFLTPAPFAVGGIALIALCLAATHMMIQKQHTEAISGSPTPNDYIAPQQQTVDKAEVVLVRETQPGSVVSYRPPSVLQHKSDMVIMDIDSANGEVANVVGTSGGGSSSSCSGGSNSAECGWVSLLGGSAQQPSLDYNTMFQQAMNEQNG